MAIAPDRTVLSSAQTLRASSRALRALPITALVVDLVVITVTVFLAAYGRNHMLVFGSGSVTESAALVGLPLVVCWVAVIALRGGYDRGVFGAGADEYKIVVNSSLFTAAFLGIGCYLTKFELSAGSSSSPSCSALRCSRSAASCSAAGCTRRAAWAR